MKYNKPVLVVIYNNKYLQNVEIINKTYKDRFSRIYHLMPYYFPSEKLSKLDNVIGVSGHPYYHQDYLYQGLENYYKEDASHYIFVADDLILNPFINENNYLEYFKLSENSSFINFLRPFNKLSNKFKKGHFMKDTYKFDRRYLELRGFDEIKNIPSFAEAVERFKLYGLDVANCSDNLYDILPRRYKFESIYSNKLLNSLAYLYSHAKQLIIPRKMDYPLAFGFADIFIIPKNDIHKLCYYCSIFAAANIVVELAIPTSLVLINDDIKLINELGYKFIDYNAPINMINAPKLVNYLLNYQDGLDKLSHYWVDDYLYAHPVKLSNYNRN